MIEIKTALCNVCLPQIINLYKNWMTIKIPFHMFYILVLYLFYGASVYSVPNQTSEEDNDDARMEEEKYLGHFNPRLTAAQSCPAATPTHCCETKYLTQNFDVFLGVVCVRGGGCRVISQSPSQVIIDD